TVRPPPDSINRSSRREGTRTGRANEPTFPTFPTFPTGRRVVPERARPRAQQRSVSPIPHSALRIPHSGPRYNRVFGGKSRNGLQIPAAKPARAGALVSFLSTPHSEFRIPNGSTKLAEVSALQSLSTILLPTCTQKHPLHPLHPLQPAQTL